MTDISEARLVELLGDFEKKIKLEMQDVQMSVDNSMLVIDLRIKKLETIIEQYHKNQFSSDYNDFQIRFEKIERELKEVNILTLSIQAGLRDKKLKEGSD